MSIKTVTNPVDDSEVTLIEGSVKKLMFKPAHPNNKFATHTASILVVDDGSDDVWINMDLNTKEGYEPSIRYAEGKKGSEKWLNLQEGDVVKLQVNPKEYNGKTYYSTKSSWIKVTKKSEGKPAQNAAKASTGTSYKKDNTGMHVGHAINGALYLQRNGAKGDVVELAKLVHDVTTQVKAEVAADQGKSVDDYDVGASVGHAILNGTRDYDGKADVAEFLKEYAKTLSATAYEVTSYVKGNTSENKKVETKPKAQPKVKPEPTPEPEGDNGFDDDCEIPF